MDQDVMQLEKMQFVWYRNDIKINIHELQLHKKKEKRKIKNDRESEREGGNRQE